MDGDKNRVGREGQGKAARPPPPSRASRTPALVQGLQIQMCAERSQGRSLRLAVVLGAVGSSLQGPWSQEPGVWTWG